MARQAKSVAYVLLRELEEYPLYERIAARLFLNAVDEQSFAQRINNGEFSDLSQPNIIMVQNALRNFCLGFRPVNGRLKELAESL